MGPWLGIAINATTLERPLAATPSRGTLAIRKGPPAGDLDRPPGPRRPADVEGAGTIGVSVQWVAEGAHPGPIVAQAPLAISPYSTPEGLAAELDLLASATLVGALHRIDTGAAADPPPVPLPRPSRGDRRPDRSTARAARRPDNRLRELVKAALFRAFLSLVVPVRNLARGRRGRHRVTVLLFHRVSDAYRDSVTVGVEQFRDIVRLLKDRYEVLDLPEFLASRGTPRRRSAVVLTFDDGYEDNLLAALLLRREGLPCTFFVSTRIVGDADAAFPHDLKNLGHRVPALSWDQVRRMAAWRFHIGNHTAHHANLAEVPLDEAIEELTQAMADLGRELGDEAPGRRWLAYPYGKAGDITDEVRERLPGLGIRYCFSAYGGSNATDFDHLDVRRQNVDYRFSPVRLRAAIEGWGTRAVSPRAGRPPRASRDAPGPEGPCLVGAAPGARQSGILPGPLGPDHADPHPRGADAPAGDT
jgi:peptidoglycan/xylan/chitin deacetylase (PgdA/CDA1 family)